MFKLPETEQEVFNIVYKHLIRQNEQAKLITCKYRLNDLYNKKVLKCAAGCLIPDEKYSSEMEGKMWNELVSLNLVPSNHFPLIQRLQVIHDTYPVDQWEKELKVVAADFGLTVPNLLDQET